MKNIIKKIFHDRVLTPCTALLISLVCVGGTAALCLYNPEPPMTDAQRYHAAVLDSITIEDDEILPLVTITPDSPLVTWQNGKVLLQTINRRPERYKAGSTVTLPGEVWTFTDREMAAWFTAHKAGIHDWPRRLKQLIGVSPDGVYTHVTAMWVSPADVVRPAYNVDIASPGMLVKLPDEVGEAYKKWFEGNIIWSYFTSAYPWTRLGYTYDWAENSGEYGLTEFLVRPGAVVEVLYTDTIDEFIRRMDQAK